MVQINQQIYDSYIKYIQTAQNGSRTEGATSTENGTKLTFDYDVLQELMADEGSEAVLLILEQLKAQGENVEGPTMQGNTIMFKVNGDSYELYIADDESPAGAKPASSQKPAVNEDYEGLIDIYSRKYGCENIFEGGIWAICEFFQSNAEFKDFIEYYKTMHMSDADIKLIETRSGGVLYVKNGDKTYMYEWGVNEKTGRFEISQKEEEYYTKDYCDLDENLLDLVDPSTGKSIAEIIAVNGCKDGEKRTYKNGVRYEAIKSDSIMETSTAYDIISILVKNGIDYEISYTDDKAKAIITIEYQGKTSQIIVENNNDATGWHQMDYIAALKGEAAKYAAQKLDDIKPDKERTLNSEEYIKLNPFGFDLDADGNIDIEKLAAQLERGYPGKYNTYLGYNISGQDLAAIFGYGIYNKEKHRYDVPDKDTIKNAIVAYMQKCGIEADKNGNYSVTDFYNAICDQENSCDSSRSQSVSETINNALGYYNYLREFGYDKYEGESMDAWPEELQILRYAMDAQKYISTPYAMMFYMTTGVVDYMSEPNSYEKNYINATCAAMLKLAGYDPEAVDNIDWDNLKDRGILEQLGIDKSDLYDKMLKFGRGIDPDFDLDKIYNGFGGWPLIEYLTNNGYSAKYYSEFINANNVVESLREDALDAIGSAYTQEDQVKVEEAEETVTETVTSYVAENIESQDNLTITQEEIDEVFENALDEEIRASVEAALNTIDNLGAADGKTAEDIVSEKIAEIKQGVELFAEMFKRLKEWAGDQQTIELNNFNNKVLKHFFYDMADKYPESYKYYLRLVGVFEDYLMSRSDDPNNQKWFHYINISNIDIAEFIRIYLQNYDEIAGFYSDGNYDSDRMKEIFA